MSRLSGQNASTKAKRRFPSPPRLTATKTAAAAAAAATVALSVVPIALASSNSCAGSSLTCRHGSSCADGPATYPQILKTNFPHLPLFDAPPSVDGRHCEVCPPDRIGVDCGTKIEYCSIITGHACLNHGECVGDGLCDCAGAHNGDGDGRTGMFAGDHCEFEAEDVCEVDGDGLETESWFCSNGGKCRHNESDINKKCNCPDGWMGPHCEFPVDATSRKKEHKSKRRPEDCTLACRNGGQCKFGTKHHEHDTHKTVTDLSPLPWLDQRAIDGMHCVCPEGYAGASCQVKVEKCGGFHCYHGAKCVKDTHCNCHTAGVSENGRQEKYAGRFCEHLAIVACEDTGGSSGGMFCTNGGKCNKDEPHKGCDCSGTGFTGPYCEYATGTEPECALPCKNGGQCRHGLNPDDAAGVHLGTRFHLDLTAYSEEKGFMHCSCPDGYIGPDCGVAIEMCGGPEEEEDASSEQRHACVNSGKCVVIGKDGTTGKNMYGCDCGLLNPPLAGKHCEYHAAVFCNDGVDSFCANGGKCKETSKDAPGEDKHPGCVCQEGWKGDHCQYKSGATVPAKEKREAEIQNKPHEENSQPPAPSASASTAEIFGVVILAAIVLGGMVIFADVFFGRVKAGRSTVASASGNNSNAKTKEEVLDRAPNESGLEPQMPHVEII